MCNHILVPGESKPKPVELKLSMHHVLEERRKHCEAKKMSHLPNDFLHYSKMPTKPNIFKMNILLKKVTYTSLAEIKDLFG